jgi:hypothetical protein
MITLRRFFRTRIGFPHFGQAHASDETSPLQSGHATRATGR